LNIFKVEVINLKTRLRKALQDIESRDKTINYLEIQLSEIINDVYLLKDRIQKLRYQMSSSTSTSNTQESLGELFMNIRNDFRYLIDYCRGNEIDVLESKDLDKLQNKTEDRLNQIEGRHAFEIHRLRGGIIEENKNRLFSQQQTINEQAEIIRKQQDFINEPEEKNQALQDQVDLYRAENYRLTESLIGIQEELMETQQNFEDQSIEYVELKNENNGLKYCLRILGLTHVDARCRALKDF